MNLSYKLKTIYTLEFLDKLNKRVSIEKNYRRIIQI